MGFEGFEGFGFGWVAGLLVGVEGREITGDCGGQVELSAECVGEGDRVGCGRVGLGQVFGGLADGVDCVEGVGWCPPVLVGDV